MSRSFQLQCCFLVVLTVIFSKRQFLPVLWSNQQSPESEVIKSASEMEDDPMMDLQIISVSEVIKSASPSASPSEMEANPIMDLQSPESEVITSASASEMEDLQEWWYDQIDSVARSWESVPNQTWCHSESKNIGLIYVKIPKTSSSTCAGINIRIARKVGERVRGLDKDNRPKRCGHTYRHGRKALLKRRSPNILWTLLRDPAKRAISEFYHFHVSRKGVEPTEERLISHVTNRKSFQFNYIADTRNPKALSTKTKNPFKDIREYVMDAYDFIGLLERKEESLALMKILWGLETEDLIVLSAKQAGGYDDGMFNKTCTKIQKPENLTAGFQSFLTSGFPRGNHDYALYAIVNRSLDKTIDYLGRGRVQKEVQRIRAMQAIAEQKCQGEAIFPCSSNGTRQVERSQRSCYKTDAGCGHKCVDQVVQEEYIISH
jgi:hypothetical protein